MQRLGLGGELRWVGVLPRHEVKHPGDVITLGKIEYRNTGINGGICPLDDDVEAVMTSACVASRLHWSMLPMLAATPGSDQKK